MRSLKRACKLFKHKGTFIENLKEYFDKRLIKIEIALRILITILEEEMIEIKLITPILLISYTKLLLLLMGSSV